MPVQTGRTTTSLTVMPPTLITDALLPKLLAARALTQLNRQVIYPRTAVVGYENGVFERGETVKIRRPKRRVATDIDPRGSGLTLTEGTWYNAEVTLERLWGDGFPVYGSDPSQARQIYINETAQQMADAIATPNDDYMYDAFRTWSATTGAVALGAHPPLAIVASMSNGTYSAFDNNVIRNAGVVLDVQNVPSAQRYAVLSSTAKGDFLGDSVAFNGFGAALNLGAGSFIQTGIPTGTFVERYGFQCVGANSVKGQTGGNMAASDTAHLVVSSTAANTQFTVGDNNNTTYIGAVNITLDASGTSLNNAVGVGAILRIDLNAGGNVAHGVVLRIDTTTATAPIITMVPYTLDGRILRAADITTAHRLVFPSIPSVNTGHHQEGLLMATRTIAEPSPGSGAVATSLVDPRSGLVIQIFQGAYKIEKLQESQAYFFLTGSRFSDWRKGVLMLSK